MPVPKFFLQLLKQAARTNPLFSFKVFFFPFQNIVSFKYHFENVTTSSFMIRNVNLRPPEDNPRPVMLQGN